MNACPMKANNEKKVAEFSTPSFRVSNKIEAFYTGGRVIFSKDGSHMFCSQDNKVNILSVETGKNVKVIKQEDGDEVTCFALSPDDEILVVAYRNLLIKQWDWKEMKCTRTWRAIHRGPIVSMTFDPTSTLLATGSSDFNIKIWDITRQYCTHSFKGSTGVVSTVQFHPYPKSEELLLFSAGDDCKVRIWDLRKNECIAVLDSHNSTVTSLAVSPDGKTLLTAGRDNIIIVWNLANYQRVKTIPIFEAVEFVMFVPNPADYEEQLKLTTGKGFHFITAGAEGVLKVWNSESSRCVYKQEQACKPVGGESKEKEIIAAVTQALYCQELDVIALVTYDHNILLYALQGFKLSKQFVGYNEEVLDIKFMGENCSHIAVASNSEQIRVFETDSHTCQILTGHSDIVLELAVFKKGLMLASCSKDNTVRLWKMDSETGKVHCVAVGKGHTHSVGTVATARLSSSFLVSGSEDQTIKVWSVPSDIPSEPGHISQLKVKFAEKAHDKDINSVAISPNDKLLATGSQDRSAKLWHLEKEVMLGSFRGHKRGIWCVRFSPTDQALATSSADGTIKIWAISNFSCVKTFEGHDASVMKFVFLTRGMQILSCGSDGLLKLWTIKSNECVKTLDEHTHKVWTLAVNNDESSVVSGGADSSLIIWEDCTEIEQEEERTKMEDQLLKEQQLSNLLHEKKFLKAIGLAITLDQPFRLLGIIKSIMEEPEGLEGLEKTLKKLRQDQIDATLRFAYQWNTNSRHCHIAQLVISIILKGRRPQDILAHPDIQQTLEGLLPYTERHFQRMNRLLQQAMFVEHTWQMMRRITAPTDSGAQLASTSTDAMDAIEDSASIDDQSSEVKRLRRWSGTAEASDESGDEEENLEESDENQSESEESESEESDSLDNDEKMLQKANVTGSTKGQDEHESEGESESDSAEEMDSETVHPSQRASKRLDTTKIKPIKRAKVTRSSKDEDDSEGELDDEGQGHSETDASHIATKRQSTAQTKKSKRAKFTRSSEGQEESSDDEEVDTEVDVTVHKVIRRGKKTEDKENKYKKETITKSVPKKKAAAAKATVKKKPSLSSAATKKGEDQTALDDYISPRRTRSSKMSNRLRKTSTSTGSR